MVNFNKLKSGSAREIKGKRGKRGTMEGGGGSLEGETEGGIIDKLRFNVN